MAFSCGFYNAINSDRTYSASDFGEMFDGLISDGVYATIGEALMVVPGAGLSVLVKSGRAWFNKTWSVNTADLPLDLGLADFLLPRIDTVILEVDTRVSVRNNSIKVITGYPAVDPVPPSMSNVEGVYQYPLANIDVAANAETIKKENIHVLVGQAPCPFVTGILDSVDISPIYQDWEGQFQTWFEGIKSSLEGDVVGNILYQLGNKVDKADKATEEDALLGTDDTKWMTPKTVGLLTDPIKSSKVGDIVNSIDKIEDERYHLCDGTTLTREEYPELFDKIGYSFGHPGLFINPESYAPINESMQSNANASFERESVIDGIHYSLTFSEVKRLTPVGYQTKISAMRTVTGNGNVLTYRNFNSPINTSNICGSPMLFSLGFDNKIYIIYSLNNVCYIDYWTKSGSTVNGTKTTLRTIASTCLTHIYGYKLDRENHTAYFVCADGDSAWTATRLSCIIISESSYQKIIVKNNISAGDAGFILGNIYYSVNQKFDIRSPTTTFETTEQDVLTFLGSNGGKGSNLDLVINEDSTQVAHVELNTAETLYLDEGKIIYKRYRVLGFPHYIDSKLNSVLAQSSLKICILPDHQIGIIAGRVESVESTVLGGFAWGCQYKTSSSATTYSQADPFVGFYRTIGLYEKKTCLFGASRKGFDSIYLYRIIDRDPKVSHINAAIIRIYKTRTEHSAFSKHGLSDISSQVPRSSLYFGISSMMNSCGIRTINAVPFQLLYIYCEQGAKGYLYGWENWSNHNPGNYITNDSYAMGANINRHDLTTYNVDQYGFDETIFRLPYQPETSTYAYIKVKD